MLPKKRSSIPSLQHNERDVANFIALESVVSFYCEVLPYVEDGARYFAAIADLPCAAWLDSAGMGRYDIMTAAPARMLADVDFGSVRRELPAAPAVDVPFAGGALGYWRYDQGMFVGIYDWALVLDHELKCAKLVSQLKCEGTNDLLAKVLARLTGEVPALADDFSVQGNISCNFTRDTYERAFAAVQRYLHEGDCYQVNLAQRFSALATGDALPAYLKLRKLSPAPYSAFLNFPGVQVLCASPERFLSVVEGRVETKPIKGTRRRDADPVRDEAQVRELLTHPKDRAENLMIVDLLRNDLGRCCEPGSVHVPGLFAIESYARVHHLVSTVRGRLARGYDALDVLRDCFPGGSITGAPKLRAMQIIKELEPDARGIYCGSIGYVGFDGRMDTNIVIRTLVYSEGQIDCWAGGGLVADSVCEAEYQETLDKASAMLELLQSCGGKL